MTPWERTGRCVVVGTLNRAVTSGGEGAFACVRRPRGGCAVERVARIIMYPLVCC